MPSKLCASIGCKERIPLGGLQYCSKHQYKYDNNLKMQTKAYNETIRKSEINIDLTNFYNSRKWRKVSKLKKELNPLCEHEGCYNNVNSVHHIIEVRDIINNNLDRELLYDLNNLKSLCEKHHQLTHHYNL